MRTTDEIEADFRQQRTNLRLAMAEPMRLVILGRIDRLLDELLATQAVPVSSRAG